MFVNTQVQYFLTNISPPFKDKQLQLNNTYIDEFYFIESIENMFLTGSLVVSDKGGALEKLPLTGEESLLVIVDQDIEGSSQNSGNSLSMHKVFEFDIYTVSVPENKAVNQTQYKLTLIEKGAFEFLRLKYSKSYAQQKISDIIKDICANQLQCTYDIEDTIGMFDYIIPYWKPVTTIKDLVKKAKRSKKPQDGGFLFYSSTENKTPIKKFYNFSTLIEKAPEKDADKRYYFKRHDINQFHINNMKEVRNPELNKRSIIATGITGKKYLGIDFTVDRSPITILKTFTNYIQSVPMMGKFAYLQNNLDNVNGDVQFFGHPQSQIQAELDYKFRMSIASSNRREVYLEGSLERYAGKTIFLEQASDNTGDTHNIQDSGTWIIKQLTHYFTNNSFKQKAIILKDSLNDTESETAIKV